METIVLENEAQSTEELVQKGIVNGISYGKYRAFVEELTSLGSTTGDDQTEALINYTLLNNKRMRRLDKTIKISEEAIEKIKSYSGKVTWLVLTESWCGDAAQTMPIMNKVAALNDDITLKIIGRDENLDLMNRFLTNKAMSIPKLIMVDDKSGKVLGEWGSRPSVATQLVIDYKDTYGTLTPEFKRDLQVWYNKDKGQTTLHDLLRLLALE